MAAARRHPLAEISPAKKYRLARMKRKFENDALFLTIGFVCGLITGALLFWILVQ